MTQRYILLLGFVCFLILETHCLKITSPEHEKLQNNNLQSFRQAQLKKHNELRNKHHSNPLVLDDTLNAFAQKYAEKLAKQGKMEHSQGDYGQNLYYQWSKPVRDYKNGAATQAWYDEIKIYNFNKPGFSSRTGHFTQVIWKDSKKVGFGFASNSKGEDYIVAEYDPPGNYEGEYNENVLPI